MKIYCAHTCVYVCLCVYMCIGFRNKKNLKTSTLLKKGLLWAWKLHRIWEKMSTKLYRCPNAILQWWIIAIGNQYWRIWPKKVPIQVDEKYVYKKLYMCIMPYVYNIKIVKKRYNLYHKNIISFLIFAFSNNSFCFNSFIAPLNWDQKWLELIFFVAIWRKKTLFLNLAKKFYKIWQNILH